ncbi:M14 family zinc carboxypeptidase [Bacteroidota bacterium]
MRHNHPTQKLFDDFDAYRETALTKRRFKHKDIKPLIEKMGRESLFDVTVVGESLEGRKIFMLSIGNGKTKILAWSQMHGDEATATMALFDIFSFFNSDDEYDEFRNKLLENVTLYFIPMLNPDGAEKFSRYNALGIDLNRDALKLTSPESKILMSVHEELQPQFGFNLHDQNSKYRVGTYGNPAAISFVAPPFNYEKSMSNTRKNSMKVIADLYVELSKIIPGHIARYNDDFEPRSFGDYFTNSNTCSILIESGVWKDDPEKQFLRRLNFAALLTGFNSIAGNYYESQSENDYLSIPENKELLFDVLLKNVNLIVKDKSYKLDIGIDFEELNKPGSNDFYKVGTIEGIGDLSTFCSYNEIDCTGLTVHQGKTYSEIFNSIDEISQINFANLFSEDFLSVKLQCGLQNEKFTILPINILKNGGKIDYSIIPQNNANFVLKDKNDTRLIVMNGFAFKPEEYKSAMLNGLIIN